jgi:hypothetical protein
LRYHHPDNWQIIHDALIDMGRRDLIGHSKHCLIPPTPPGDKAAAIRHRMGAPAARQGSGKPGQPRSSSWQGQRTAVQAIGGRPPATGRPGAKPGSKPAPAWQAAAITATRPNAKSSLPASGIVTMTMPFFLGKSASASYSTDRLYKQDTDDGRLTQAGRTIGLAQLCAGHHRGQPEGHCVRSCWIGMHIGRAIGLDSQSQWELYYAIC